MKIFYDTEFLEDGRTIDLISIGMVREDGKEYYAVNYNMPLSRIIQHPWLMDNVMPHIPCEQIGLGNVWRVDPNPFEVKELHEIAAEVRNFIRGTEDPELWAYYGAYDHVVLAQLYGPMINLPQGIPMYTNDIKQEMNRLSIKQHHLPIDLHGALNHKAIDDAHWNMSVMRFLEKVEYEIDGGYNN